MRRIIILFIPFLLGVSLLPVVLAQAPDTDEDGRVMTPVPPPPPQPPPHSLFLHPISPEEIDTPLVPVSVNEGDLCTAPITVEFFNQAVGRVVLPSTVSRWTWG